MSAVGLFPSFPISTCVEYDCFFLLCVRPERPTEVTKTAPHFLFIKYPVGVIGKKTTLTMENRVINFRPFVGKNYATTGFQGKRILILGESHYCKAELAEGGRCFPLCKADQMVEDCFSQTEDVLNDFIYNYYGDASQRTFLCFERAFLGKELTQEERENFWESIMFYNYLQFSQPGPRCPIAEEYWGQSEQAFRQLLETYLPDYIISWGVRLFDGMPGWGGEASKLIVDGDSTDIWTYTINGKSIPMLKVHHPSSPTGKCWEYWHKFYKAFLQQ